MIEIDISRLFGQSFVPVSEIHMIWWKYLCYKCIYFRDFLASYIIYSMSKCVPKTNCGCITSGWLDYV